MGQKLTKKQKKFVKENIGLAVWRVNNNWRQRLRHIFEYQDMVSMAYVGLCKAAIKWFERYEEWDCSFSTIAVKRIDAEFQHYFARADSKWHTEMQLDSLEDYKVENDGNVEIAPFLQMILSQKNKQLNFDDYIELKDYIQSMSEADRNTLYLDIFTSLSHEEIAEKLGISKATVYYRTQKHIKERKWIMRGDN